MKLAASTVLAIGLLASAFAFAQVQSRLEGPLAGAGNDKGKGKWQTRDRGTEMQAQLQVEGENLVPNTTLIVTIGGNTPWSVQTDAFGTFRLMQVYNSAARPTIPSGSSVVVTDSQGNTVLLGTLRPR